MIRPCPTTVECPGSEFATELFGNGDNPFLNLSIEGPEPIWVPPVTEYFTAQGRCCDGILKFSYGDTQTLANAALNKKIADECIVCDPNKPQKFCADAKCPDGSLIARVCVTSSYADALAEANRIKAALEKYCPDVPGHSFTNTCSCTDGQNVLHTQTAHSPDSQEAAVALCLSSLPDCGHGQDSGNEPQCPVPPCTTPDPFPNPNPTPTCPPFCPPPPPPGTFCNSDQECTVYCPDGLPFTKHVPKGTFCRATQKQADDQAKLYACQRAALEIICIGDLDLWPCLWQEASADITMSGLGNLTVDLVVPGSLPPGLTLEQISNTKMRISGTPTDGGIFDFQILVGDAFGNAQVKDFSISVFGVDYDTRTPLPEAAVGQCYDHQFSALGPYVAPLIWQFVNIPDGLAHDGNGRIFGTPTTAGDFNAFGLFLSDSDEPFRECIYQFQQHIRDCATDIYPGIMQGTIAGSPPPQIVTFPKEICSHVIHALSSDLTFLGTGGFIQIVIKKNGVNQASWFASTSGPFDRQITQFFTIPAQYPASGACPEAPAFNDIWTAVITGSTTDPEHFIIWQFIGV